MRAWRESFSTKLPCSRSGRPAVVGGTDFNLIPFNTILVLILFENVFWSSLLHLWPHWWTRHHSTALFSCAGRFFFLARSDTESATMTRLDWPRHSLLIRNKFVLPRIWKKCNRMTQSSSMGSQMQQTTFDKVSKKYKDEYGFKGYQVEISSTNYGRAVATAAR